MCVFHKFCIVCFCVYLLSQSAAADVEGNHTNDGHAGKEINATGSRDQNVKNVIHVHKHYDTLIDGNIPDMSLEEGLHYVRLIFEKFGDKDRIKVEHLETFYRALGHADHEHDHSQKTEHDHSEHTEHDHGHSEHTEHKENITNTEYNHDDNFHNEMKSMNKTEDETNSGDHEKIEKNRHKRSDVEEVQPHLYFNHTECLDVQSILKVYNFDKEIYLTNEQFLHLSPAVIYQLSNPKCKVSGHSDHVNIESDTVASVGFSGVTAAVWGYSTLAVVIISLVGLLGVAVIPIMQKVFYNHLLQFLVALAVGALTGDAMLHLLPHAIVGESLHHEHGHGSHDSHKNHQSAVLKGLCGLAGIFFFFLMERVLTIFTKIKRKRKQSKRRTLSPKQITVCKDDGNHIAKKLSAYDESDYQSCEEMVMVVHPNKSLKGYADETHDKIFHTSHDGCHPKESKHSHSKSNPQAAEEEGMLSLPHNHSGHSHHAHCEMLTNSVASVAWMVILGDGIHNFSDGLAIGAAFANSITGGVSTAIAVFCHELPHEIGDFAVLLRAGMSVKQAIVYNILSSVMCFIGMLIGVAIGNIDEASQWIFAAVAGMFIYIATVDMLPEMTSVDTKQGEHPFCHLFLQCVGMIFGAGIMLLIAYFEEDLLTALDG